MPPQDNHLDELRAACEGLLYPSESDSPIDVFSWTTNENDARQAVIAHEKSGRKIDEIVLDQFFNDLNSSDDAPRFAALRQVIANTIRNARAFRAGAGEVEIDIYIVGRSRFGVWVGIHTRSIET